MGSAPGAPDYKALGFRAGLEIHQQLDTPKLFCRCPSCLDESDDADVRFTRQLKPTASELGEIDRAAVEEARKSLTFEYLGSRATSCLVEMDEEPPHDVTPEALDVALQASLLLKAKPVDEVHVMRKIVVDGSNTSGFQRTALLATDGLVEAEGGNVRLATLCLEEDSARRLERAGNLQRYRLDRLGVPLIEIATETDIHGPQHAREVAEAIGMALRATGRVKRGIGTIRQDLNVSIREGARVEMKGVQELRLVAPAIEWEVRRQVHLLDIRKELEARGAKEGDYLRPVVDVTDAFARTEAKMVKSALASGAGVFALALPHLAGLLGKKLAQEKDAMPATRPAAASGSQGASLLPPPRVGRELADYAKVKAGVKGIFHSDELPAYGITPEECGEVVSRLNLGATDAFALVVEKRATADVALHAVRDRAVQLLRGVPEETRDVEPDGTSRYLRPLPGGARMYPETDVPPVTIDAGFLAHVKLPELPAQKLARFAREYPDLSAEQARQLVRGGDDGAFERLAKEVGLVRETARLLLSTLPEIGAPDAPEPLLRDALHALKHGAFAKEAMPQVVKRMIEARLDARQAAAALGLGAADRGEIAAFVDAQIERNRDLVQRQGERAAGALMGPVMAKFKGQISGQELSALVQERLKRALQG